MDSNYDRTVRVAIVGTGKRARGGDWLAVAHHHAAAFSAVADCLVTAVVEPDSGRRRAFMRQFGVEHGFRSLSELADARHNVPVDLAVLVVPDALHVELADEALELRFHTLVEKPITPGLSDARALFAHASRRQLGLWESSQRRYMTPGLQKAVRSIGPVQRGHFEWLRDSGTPYWRDHTRERRGAFADLGSHGIKQMLALLDYGDVAYVNAWMYRADPDRVEHAADVALTPEDPERPPLFFNIGWESHYRRNRVGPVGNVIDHAVMWLDGLTGTLVVPLLTTQSPEEAERENELPYITRNIDGTQRKEYLAPLLTVPECFVVQAETIAWQIRAHRLGALVLPSPGERDQTLLVMSILDAAYAAAESGGLAIPEAIGLGSPDPAEKGLPRA